MPEGTVRDFGKLEWRVLFRGSAASGAGTNGNYWNIGGKKIVGLFCQALDLGAASNVIITPQTRYDVGGESFDCNIGVSVNPLAVGDSIVSWLITLSNINGVYFPGVVFDTGAIDTVQVPVPVLGVGRLRVNCAGVGGTATDVCVAVALKED